MPSKQPRADDGGRERRRQQLCDELHEQRKEYLAERELLVRGEHQAIQEYDKSILTLSASALAFSIALTGFLHRRTEADGLLVVTWICFLVAVLSTVVSLFASHFAFQARRGELDIDYARQAAQRAKDFGEPLPTSFESARSVGDAKTSISKRMTQSLNILSLLAFTIGIVCLVVFITFNLTQAEARMSEKKFVPVLERTLPDASRTNGAIPPARPVPPLLVSPQGSPQGSREPSGSGGSDSPVKD